MSHSALFIALVVAFATCACDKEDKPTDPAAKKKIDSPEKDKAKQTPPKQSGPKGLAAKDNDPKLVKLVKDVVACKWGVGGPENKCEAIKAMRSAKEFTGKSDTTLLNLLEDKDEKVRWIGAQQLLSWGSRDYSKDKSSAARIVAAAQAETDKENVWGIGLVAARVDGAKTGQTENLRKLMTGHASKVLRQALAQSYLRTNKTGDEWDFVVKLITTEKVAAVRADAVRGITEGGTPKDRAGKACEFLLGLGLDADKHVWARAVSFVGQNRMDGGCKGQWDGLLALLQKRATEGTVDSSRAIWALTGLQKQAAASDAQKKTGLAVATAVIGNEKNNSRARSEALSFVAKVDAPAAKVLAAKYKDDKNSALKRAAAKILGGK